MCVQAEVLAAVGGATKVVDVERMALDVIRRLVRAEFEIARVKRVTLDVIRRLVRAEFEIACVKRMPLDVIVGRRESFALLHLVLLSVFD